MLNHIGQSSVAEKIQNAWLTTLEEGTHTYDIYKEGISKVKVGTNEFADAVISNLGKTPNQLPSVKYDSSYKMVLPKYKRKNVARKELEGVDLFVHWSGENPNELAEKVSKITPENLKLSMITNRGIKVWPDGFKETFCTDHWRCRFKPINGDLIQNELIIQALQSALIKGIDVIKTENLYRFNGISAYSLGQGQ